MLLIFDASIWGEQAFWRTERYDNPNFLPLPVWSYPPMVLYSLANFCLARLRSLCSCLCVSVLTTIRPLFVCLVFISTPSPLFFCVSFSSLCSTESNGDRPSPTGLCWRPTLRRWSVSPVSSTLSLPPSVPTPLPSPSRFVTSVDNMTGRDSRTTSQFPPGLGYFTLGLQKDFQLTWLYTHTKKKNPNSKSTPRA